MNSPQVRLQSRRRYGSAPFIVEFVKHTMDDIPCLDKISLALTSLLVTTTIMFVSGHDDVAHGNDENRRFWTVLCRN